MAASLVAGYTAIIEGLKEAGGVVLISGAIGYLLDAWKKYEEARSVRLENKKKQMDIDDRIEHEK